MALAGAHSRHFLANLEGPTWTKKHKSHRTWQEWTSTKDRATVGRLREALQEHQPRGDPVRSNIPRANTLTRDTAHPAQDMVDIKSQDMDRRRGA